MVFYKREVNTSLFHLKESGTIIYININTIFMIKIDKSKNSNTFIVRLNNDFTKNYDGLFAIEFVKDAVQTTNSNLIYSPNVSIYKDKFLQFNLVNNDIVGLGLGDYYLNFYHVSGSTESISNKPIIYKAFVTVINTGNDNIIYNNNNNQDIIYTGNSYDK